ncbi:MAG: SRPBCC domain-containing protein [Alphaproteobacteria bacterium]|nr:SRPBCC domain-containing protein [Alphaproteobacteria bacterium]
MTNAPQITVETTIAAPVVDVWRAYVTPADIMVWNTALESWHTTKAVVDLREGGVFSSRMEAKDGSMGFDFAGTYTRIIPLKHIGYDFGDRKAAVDFTGPDGAVSVRVVFDAETENPIEMQRGGWQAILDNFKRFVEARAAG